MARWLPHASERLAQAALELFADAGYDVTSVADIAARAGLTKTTFFRHFRDKREVLFGDSSVDQLLVDAIAAAPRGATALQAVARVLDEISREIYTLERREFLCQRHAVIAAHSELQERDALKTDRLVSAMTEALVNRGHGQVQARAAATLASLATMIAFERWTHDEAARDFADLARNALAETAEAVAMDWQLGSGLGRV